MQACKKDLAIYVYIAHLSLILLWLNKSTSFDHHIQLSVHEYHANMPEEISSSVYS